MAKVAITNVLVFDGEAVMGPKTVAIDGTVIQSDPTGATTTIDGTGCMVLPGFIDCHVHIGDKEDLKTCAKFGVTTVCDLGAYPKEVFPKLKAAEEGAEYFSSGLVAHAPGSMHARAYENFGKDLSLKNEAEVSDWVKERVSEGVDFLKVIADEPGLDQSTLNKLGSEGKAAGKQLIGHAADIPAYRRVLTAGYDMVTHTPPEKDMDDAMIQQLLAQETAVIPTLFMSQLVLATEAHALMLPQGAKLETCLKNAEMMHRAGIPILAGTDANPFGLGGEYGQAMHEEIALLVQAGMVPIDALKAATSSPARWFNFKDRGRIAPGLRADLVLVEGDPTRDIADIQKIRKVWVAGVEVV
jgi:imidazolonepropionase-like amidohydrolase